MVQWVVYWAPKSKGVCIGPSGSMVSVLGSQEQGCVFKSGREFFIFI